MIEFEKAGVASVAIVAAGFEEDTKHAATVFSMPNLPYVVAPHTFTSRSPEQVKADVEPLIGEMIKGITTPPPIVPGQHGEAGGPRRSESEIFQGVHTYDAWEKMNEAFMERGWGDGFPLVAPTPEKVEAALKAVTKAPLEVLGQLAPGNGLVTVEKIAINCVMAGCMPEHLPVLVTAVEAMLKTPQSIFPIRTIAQSTGPHFFILLINGPVVKRLGINSGMCMLGPGKPGRVNTVLGRALRLIMMNVGYSYPGNGDMDTIGTAHKYSFCLAENEDASPWPAFHEDRGFRKDQSTVTVLGGEDVLHVKDYNNNADELLNTWSCAAAYPREGKFEQRLEFTERHCLMMIAPDHARIMAEYGYSKRGIREYVAAHSLAPIKRINSELRNRPDAVKPQWRWTLTADQEMLIPVIQDPDDIHMAVMGGPTGKSDFARLMGQPTVTVEITCAVAATGKSDAEEVSATQTVTDPVNCESGV
jgi:hypothetical protein